MKFSKLYINFLIFFASISLLNASEPQQTQGYLSRLYSKGKQFIARTPIMPGWHSTQQEKEVALETLKQLLVDKDELETQLQQNIELTVEQKKEMRSTLSDISKNIDEQKIILGTKWSRTRKALAATAGVGTAIGLGAHAREKYKQFTYVPILDPAKKHFAEISQTMAPLITKKPLPNRADITVCTIPLIEKDNISYKWQVQLSQGINKEFSGSGKTESSILLGADKVTDPTLTVTLYAKKDNKDWTPILNFRPGNAKPKKQYQPLPGYLEFLEDPN